MGAERSKDIASHEDLYQVLINSKVSTVDKFVTCCRQVEAKRKKRVVPLRYERQPKVTPISTANEEDLSQRYSTFFSAGPHTYDSYFLRAAT
ncbi:hypothetical protein TNCV_4998451 [Trichonephila clavipes]|nr:hypothetical protein TNCV_4998451 [Trichonephila clavipes]